MTGARTRRYYARTSAINAHAAEERAAVRPYQRKYLKMVGQTLGIGAGLGAGLGAVAGAFDRGGRGGIKGRLAAGALFGAGAGILTALPVSAVRGIRAQKRWRGERADRAESLRNRIGIGGRPVNRSGFGIESLLEPTSRLRYRAWRER
jgi:hypothetical protein